MAISPTTAGYTNTGHDLHMTVVLQDGQTIHFENVMQFDARQETQDITRVRLDNRVLVADLPKLWTGTIQYDRADNSTDKAIGQIESDWFNGNDYTLGSMVINVITKAGTQSPNDASPSPLGTGATIGGLAGENTTITFYDVALKLDDSGTWRGDDATTCRLGFRAARRNVSPGVTGFGVNASLNQGV